MKINVEVFGDLVKYTGFKSRSVDVVSGVTAKDVKVIIGIPLNYPSVILINNAICDISKKLEDNDTVKYLMIVNGG